MSYRLSPTNLKTVHVKTTEDQLKEFQITDGAIYLCTDSGNIYYDINNERKKISSSSDSTNSDDSFWYNYTD